MSVHFKPTEEGISVSPSQYTAKNKPVGKQ